MWPHSTPPKVIFMDAWDSTFMIHSFGLSNGSGECPSQFTFTSGGRVSLLPQLEKLWPGRGCGSPEHTQPLSGETRVGASTACAAPLRRGQRHATPPCVLGPFAAHTARSIQAGSAGRSLSHGRGLGLRGLSFFLWKQPSSFLRELGKGAIP